jgi:formylglycine-generating enzyme required for sulfatase activity
LSDPDPFPDDGPILQAGSLGWKEIVGIVVLAGLGYVAADRLGWVGGDRAGVPFAGTPVDSVASERPAPAARERATQASAGDSGAGTPATAAPGETPGAAPPGARTAPAGEQASPATEPPAGQPQPEPRAPATVVEDGPLPLSEFVLVRPGSFQMGFADAAADQQPVHAVILSQAFYLQRSEVTQGQWQGVMGSNPSHNTACGADCPVEQVSWHDVQAFIQALNERYPGRGYRLPTEAEWEYAARADARGAWDDAGTLEEEAWFDANSGARTRPVESKLPNAWGLYDMRGNVAEWVADWYRADYYRTGPAVDPPGPRDGAAKVVRGGSWGSSRRFVGTLGRMDRDPFTRDFNIGFRLARDP